MTNDPADNGMRPYFCMRPDKTGQEKPFLKALDALKNDYAPAVKKYADGKRRGAFWAPPQPPVAKAIRVPSWAWTLPTYARHRKTIHTVNLDVSGAYLAPLSGTTLAHGTLRRVGDLTGTLPGYYQVTAHDWEDTRIVSPLGGAAFPKTERKGEQPKVWITLPLLILLRELERTGHWPEVEIHDSFTPEHTWRPTKCAAWLREERLIARDTSADMYTAVKTGYSTAITMINVDTDDATRKSEVARRDWNQSIITAHFVNTWRKAWRTVSEHNLPLYQFSGTDEITMSADSYQYLLALPEDQRPLRLDQTGTDLGTFKLKSEHMPLDEQ